MEKDKRVIAVENSQSLMRVGVQLGLVNKVLEEERKEYWTLRLNKLRKDKLFDDLLAESEKCVSELPNWYFGYFCRGLVKIYLKDFEGSILDCNKVIGLNLNNHKAYNIRGMAKLFFSVLYGTKESSKDYDADFDKAIELNQKDAEAYNNRGVLKSMFRSIGDPISDFDKAIELNQKDARAYYNRGNARAYYWAYNNACKNENKNQYYLKENKVAYDIREQEKVYLKDYESAILDHNKAIELDPTLVSISFTHGKALINSKKMIINYLFTFSDITFFIKIPDSQTPSSID